MTKHFQDDYPCFYSKEGPMTIYDGMTKRFAVMLFNKKEFMVDAIVIDSEYIDYDQALNEFKKLNKEWKVVDLRKYEVINIVPVKATMG